MPVQVGDTFARLRVIAQLPGRKYRCLVWECLCDPELSGCGAKIPVDSASLNSGNTRSCGCLAADAAKAVGLRNAGGAKAGPVPAKAPMPPAIVSSRARGEHHHRALLTRDLVVKARRLRADGIGFEAIRAQLKIGVGTSALIAAVTGRTWKSAPFPGEKP